MAMKKRHPHKTNILLVNITRLGDMLQATPTIAGMKLENPDCKVTVVVEKQFEGICKIIPNIDDVVSIDLGMTVRSLAREQTGIIDGFEYVTEFVEELRSRKFDYCLNMSSSAYTALLLKIINIGRNGGWTSDEEGYRIIESEWARLFATSVFHQNRQFNSLNLVDVFRCSADVEQHPKKLLLDIPSQDLDYAKELLRDAGFTNTGPIIAIQAGASQEKRQWLPQKFVRLINLLTEKYNARVVLTGTTKELAIINPIKESCKSSNVFVAAGKTTIPQLGALLKLSNILITGDTGPMHMSVAVGTPVIAMFLASAYGFETGPYSEGNIVLQPVIACGPCNPNKPCARPDCHDTIEPEMLAELTMKRLSGDIATLPDTFADPSKVIVYKSIFDEFGFCDLVPLNSPTFDHLKKHRDAYRKLWLNELGGYAVPEGEGSKPSSLTVFDNGLSGVDQAIGAGQKGVKLIEELVTLIKDVHSSPSRLSAVNKELSQLDRVIEEIGFNYQPLGPVTRMFVFAKENLLGTEALDLASQMGRVYEDLARRTRKLAQYYQTV